MILFLLGLIFTIPLAILANILTPRCQAALARRNASQRDKQATIIRQEISRVKKYHDGPISELISYASQTIIYLIAQFTLIIVLATGVFTVLSNNSYPLWLDIPLAGIVLTLLLITNNEASKAWQLFRRIQNYDTYIAKLEAKITSLKIADESPSNTNNHQPLVQSVQQEVTKNET